MSDDFDTRYLTGFLPHPFFWQWGWGVNTILMVIPSPVFLIVLLGMTTNTNPFLQSNSYFTTWNKVRGQFLFIQNRVKLTQVFFPSWRVPRVSFARQLEEREGRDSNPKPSDWESYSATTELHSHWENFHRLEKECYDNGLYLSIFVSSRLAIAMIRQ